MIGSFHVVHPKSLDEAVRLLTHHGPDAMVIAGGTDVVPNLQMRLFSPRVLVDVKPLRTLSGIEFSPSNGLRIGALTTLTQLLASPVVREKVPVLSGAVATIAGPLQRNMGTLGGNLCLETRCRWYNQSHLWRTALGGCLKKDGDICHVAPGGKFCWAAWSGDSAPALLTLEAEIEIAGPAGVRCIPLASFYKKDGKDRINLATGEILTAVRVPVRMAGRRGVYRKLRVRDSIDYPLAGVAFSMDVDEAGVCRDARLALTGVNPAPLLVRQAGELLAGRKLSGELIGRVAHAAIQTAKPLTTSASTPVYRREMVQLFTRRALEEAWDARDGGSGGGGSPIE
ncbi:MAG TPA: FAD binding domain-containing protein [Candidatus Acidoferrales bacterium]|nr:FAD binding domain-containing protein [Candidatus Acidoferrales bacterium]